MPLTTARTKRVAPPHRQTNPNESTAASNSTDPNPSNASRSCAMPRIRSAIISLTISRGSMRCGSHVSNASKPTPRSTISTPSSP